MEYLYAALLLHKMGKPITEEALRKVIAAAGAESDINESKVKALVASLKGIDIDKELESATVMAAPTTAGAEVKAEKKEEKKEEAAEGLSALFG